MLQTADAPKNQNKQEKEPVLEIRNVKKYFDVSEGWLGKNKKYLKAVNDVSLKVYPGETLGIVGESGCGKSTLGNTIMGLHRPTAGEVIFDGEDLNQLSAKQLRMKRKDLQMIFQDPFSSLNPRMKVFDIIAEPLRTHKAAAGKELEKRVHELLDVVGLSAEYADRWPHEFSGGQRQRIGIARALALNPKVLVCDEAVSALDVSIQAQILNLLKRLQQEFNLTYIFIAHGMPAIHYISDRVAVMYLGEIVELTTKEKLFAGAVHPYTKGLLGSVPIPEPKQKKNLLNKASIEGDMPNPVDRPKGCAFHTRCPYATVQCKEESPELEEKRSDHWAACHFPLL